MQLIQRTIEMYHRFEIAQVDRHFAKLKEMTSPFHIQLFHDLKKTKRQRIN